MLDMESFGGKIRDTEDEFKGAEFRDDETKLMFAYDYKNKFTLRVWGSTFKPSLYKEYETSRGSKFMTVPRQHPFWWKKRTGKNAVSEPSV